MNSKKLHYEIIAREGYPFFVPVAIVSFICWRYGLALGSFVLFAAAVAIAAFFRNPERDSPADDGSLLSPADGVVAQIMENARSENIDEPSLTRVSIFMSVLNVHVNRWPMSGTVKKITHAPGSFLDARDPEASTQNEHNSIVLQGKDSTIEVVQIAGKIARRIACWVDEGDEGRRGERFGLIRFGSRLDVYFPKEYEAAVNVGDKVKAGVTVIAGKAVAGNLDEAPGSA
jgi:phosphatidylserine decarboxylase